MTPYADEQNTHQSASETANAPREMHFFKDQKWVPTITEERLAAHAMEKFRFAVHGFVRRPTASENDAREEALQLIEEAIIAARGDGVVW